jgi:hypothetical protein
MRHLIGSLDGHVAVARSCNFSDKFSIGCHDRSVTRGLSVSIFSHCSSIPFESRSFFLNGRQVVVCPADKLQAEQLD